MRRKDREKDEAFAIDVIRSCAYGVLAMAADNKPYCIPISPVWLNGCVYFHSAVEGYKCDLLRQNAHVCLTCVCDTELVPQQFTTKYKSAVVVGTCVLVEDAGEKERVLLDVVQKYAPSNAQKAKEAIANAAGKTLVYKILPTAITGKGNV